MNKHWVTFCKGIARVVLLSGLQHEVAIADDTDLFMGVPGRLPAVNVLFLLDNSSAAGNMNGWPASTDCPLGSAVFCYEKAGLKELALSVKGQPLSMGLMVFSGIGKDGGDYGAYVRSALKTMNAAGTADWVTRIDSLDASTEIGAPPAYALALHEAYLYFHGLSARSGNQPKADPAAFDVIPRYRKTSASCNRNYLVIISNGVPDSTEDATAQTLLSGLGGRLAGDPLALQPTDFRGNWSDEYARFLNLSGIVSHSFDITPQSTTEGKAKTSWLKSIAQEGRGRYFAISSADDLQKAIRSVLLEISAEARGFTSAALPIDASARGTQLDQIYVGLFRPSLMPRWSGNLKHYTLSMDATSGGVQWLDSQGKAAVDATDGTVRDDSISYWTKVSDYWRFRCGDARGVARECGNPVSVSDIPDGAVVEKGGAGQRLREGFAERKLYTCPLTGGCTAGEVLGKSSETLFQMENSSIKPADLKAADAVERNKIIDWVRGVDNADLPERNAGEVRPSIAGDVVHSRPLAVDYNRDATGCRDRSGAGRDVVVFYAGNDGVLHAVRGGHDADDAGSELWGFIPREAWPRFKRLRDNTPAINFPSIPLDENNKPYLFDGPLTVWMDDADHDCRYTPGVDSVLLFAGMRRAGRALYAFDITRPEQPRFLWRKDSSSPGFAELGQSWSALEPARVQVGSASLPVVVMGAGYDPASEDRGFDLVSGGYQNPKATQPGMGRGVYVLAARTGEILRAFGTADGMTKAIPSDVAVLKRRDSGLAYRAYVGDTGGKVWRMNLEGTDPRLWKVSELARLGGTGNDARKFMNPPDVVKLDEGYAVLLGSGDREHPFDRIIRNRFFMLKDDGTDKTWMCESDARTCDLNDATQTIPVGTLNKGWFFNLGEGERVVGGSTTLTGTVYFPTHQAPVSSASACVPDLGVSRLYALNYATAAGAWPDKSRFRELLSRQGMMPTPMPFVMKTPIQSGTNTDGTTNETDKVQGLLTGNGVEKPAESVQKKRKVWWMREHEN